jgi:hypothetical protein
MDRKVLYFPRNLVASELHEADGVERLAVVCPDEFGDPKITAANDSSDSEPLFVRLTLALVLYVASTAGSLPCSSSFRNKARNAGFHHFIQPLSGLNAIDFVKRVFRKRRDVEILSRAGRSPGRGKQSRAALHRPSQQHLCRRFSNSRSDSETTGSSSGRGLIP